MSALRLNPRAVSCKFSEFWDTADAFQSASSLTGRQFEVGQSFVASGNLFSSGKEWFSAYNSPGSALQRTCLFLIFCFLFMAARSLDTVLYQPILRHRLFLSRAHHASRSPRFYLIKLKTGAGFSVCASNSLHSVLDRMFGARVASRFSLIHLACIRHAA